MDFVDRVFWRGPLITRAAGRHSVHSGMNYLAHAYLSFGDDPVLVGNMISDFVKGREQYDYPPRVAKGIRLHRHIDTFTDTDPANKEAKKLLDPAAGRYSGAFLDIVYDHFLALDAGRFPLGVEAFARHTYTTLRRYHTLLPDAFDGMLVYMEAHDWLSGYRTRHGIRSALAGLARRARYLPDGAPVFELFEEHYAELEAAFLAFFPGLESYAREQFDRE